MERRRNRLLAAAGGLLVVALAIIVAAVVISGRGDSKADAPPPATTTAASTATGSTTPAIERPEIAPADGPRYVKLFRSLVVKQTTSDVLRRWPKPYQQYRDQFADRCYEWKIGRVLYDLCFKHDVLVLTNPPL